MFIKRIVTIGLLMNFLIGAVPKEDAENSDTGSGFSSSSQESNAENPKKSKAPPGENSSDIA